MLPCKHLRTDRKHPLTHVRTHCSRFNRKHPVNGRYQATNPPHQTRPATSRAAAARATRAARPRSATSRGRRRWRVGRRERLYGRGRLNKPWRPRGRLPFAGRCLRLGSRGCSLRRCRCRSLLLLRTINTKPHWYVTTCDQSQGKCFSSSPCIERPCSLLFTTGAACRCAITRANHTAHNATAHTTQAGVQSGPYNKHQYLPRPSSIARV